MSSLAFIRCFAVASLLVGLAGCGGGSNGSTGGGGGGGGPTAVTFTIKGPAPTVVAAQIGSGAFTAETVNSSGAVSLSIPEGTTKFAVAVNCAQQSQTVGTQIYTLNYQFVMEASTADGTSFTAPCPAAPATPQLGKLTGSVDASAIAGANYVGVTAGNGTWGSQGYFLSGASSNFSLMMPSGTDRVALEGYVYSESNPYGANSVWTLAAIRNLDGVTVAGSVNGGTTVSLGASDAVTQQPITYNNVPDNYSAPSTFAEYLWNGNGGVWLSNGATTQYPVVPAAAAEAGDSYLFFVNVFSNSNIGEVVGLTTTSATGGPQTFTFPKPWTYAGPAPAALPTFQMDYAGFAGKTGVVNTAALRWQTGTGASNQFNLQVAASGNYQNGSTMLVMPDLSGVPGFLTPPASGVHATWDAEILQKSNGFLQQSAAIGETQTVGNGGLYTVP